MFFYVSFFKDFISLFLERRERKEKERQRNINVSLPLECPPLRTQPATQACALTGDRTGDPLIHWVAFNPLSYTSQGYVSFKLLFITYENADVIYSEDHGTSLPYVVLIQCFSKCGTSEQQYQHQLGTFLRNANSPASLQTYRVRQLGDRTQKFLF